MSHGGDVYRNKVKLDFSVNLSPLPLPENIRKAMYRGLDEAVFYPDTEQTAVRRALADTDGLGSDYIFAGSGASELIMACVKSAAPKKVLLITPCYTGYLHALGSNPHLTVSEYKLKVKDEFRLTEDVLEYMDESTDLMFLTDPWNPNGANIPDSLLKSILEKAQRLGIWVILDQSFLFMSDKTALSFEHASCLKAINYSDTADMVRQYSKLFMIRSYTKLFALPGIRMGYIISLPNNIKAVRRQLPEWNLSSVAAAAMTACAEEIKNTSYVHDCITSIKTEREYLIKALKQPGFRIYESNAPYILFKSEHELYNELLKHGILIRDCSDYTGLGKGYCRIAVKDHDSNMAFADALYAAIGK